MKAKDFGNDFYWGFATSAAQIEGGWKDDEREPSIWDTFAARKKIGGSRENNPSVACDHFHLYKNDVAILNRIGVNAYRFSISWSRVLKYGKGTAARINEKGIDFYQRLTDELLSNNIEPFITLYHWDLPQALADKKGWLNRDIVSWFNEYADIVSDKLGDRVQNWIVLNEPLMFCLLGYGIGMHAPGKKGINSLTKSIHHANLAQATAGSLLKSKNPKWSIGTSNAIIDLQPYRPENRKDIQSMEKYRALFSRTFIEPYLGMGYPVKELPWMKKIEKFMRPEDEMNIQFQFDFWGVNHYSRMLIKNNPLIPYVKGRIIPPAREAKKTQMGWEVYPQGLYNVLNWMSSYQSIKNIMVTENGAAMDDQEESGKVHDADRIQYYEDYLNEALRAKKEGVPLSGYFAWSLLDNFEWAEGYHPRFGMVYVDYETRERYLKDSAFWYQNFLKN